MEKITAVKAAELLGKNVDARLDYWAKDGDVFVPLSPWAPLVNGRPETLIRYDISANEHGSDWEL